jgi:hypothetical protein
MFIRRAFLQVLIMAALAAAAFALPTHAQNPCDGLVAPRLTAGGAARITTAYGLSLKDRAATGAAGSTEVALLSYGTVASVLDGPSCSFGYVWWNLQLSNGTTGWAAEGGSAGTDYFMEPYAVGLNVYHRSADSTRLTHYFVQPDGTNENRGDFVIQPASGTPQTAWQQVEIDQLTRALDTVRQDCPDRLMGSDLASAATNEAALQLPLPALDYDYYPSPEGERLVLVRHQHLRVPRCDNVVPLRMGMSTVSILNKAGVETVLFPFPQHGSIPDSVDTYKGSEPTDWSVALDEVIWSPQGQYIAFVAAYRYPCNRQECYRYHMYVSNLETGQLYVLGEGRHVGWSSGGERINFFRLIAGADGKPAAHLYTARPDGTDRQKSGCRADAVTYRTRTNRSTFPGMRAARVMVGNAGIAEVMMFNLADRTFTPPMLLPDLMPQANRLAVYLVQGEKGFFWCTIRGEFVIQSALTGEWKTLESSVAATGVAPVQVRPFPIGDKALVETADGGAYILDLAADQLAPVVFVG